MKINALGSLNTRYLLNTRRYLLLAVTLALLSAILVFAVIIPRVQASWDLFEDLQETNEVVESLERKNQELQQVSRSRFLAQADQVNQLIPSKKPLLELLNGLNAVAGNTGVRYEDISLIPGSISTQSATQNQEDVRSRSRSRSRRSSVVTKETETLDVKLNVLGTIDQIGGFIRGMESIAPFTSVTTMELLEQGGSVGGEFPYQAEFSLSSHFFNQPISVVVSQPLPQFTSSHEQTLNEIGSFIYPPTLDQRQIQGGGLFDLFGVGRIEQLGN